jgi:hypothetical protein
MVEASPKNLRRRSLDYQAYRIRPPYEWSET